MSPYGPARRGWISAQAHVEPDRGSGAEQLGFGRGEFLVGQHALLVQFCQLVQLVDHGRGRGRGRGILVRRGLLICRLLLQIADPRVLLLLQLGLLGLAPGRALPRQIRTAAHHGRAQQRTSPSEHRYLLRSSGSLRGDEGLEFRGGREAIVPTRRILGKLELTRSL